MTAQPRRFFGDGDFDFDDGFGFRGFGLGCFGCGFGWGWGWGSWSWWNPWWPNTWWGWPVASVYPYSNPNRNTESTAESAPMVAFYLNDGTTLVATDYWIAEGQLHYRGNDGSESTLDMNDLDWQRTVDENAKRGVSITLKPQPGR